MSEATPVPVSDEEPAQSRSVVNRRARRVLSVFLVLLILLLVASTYIAYRAIRVPASGAATDGGAGKAAGIEWVRSIYGTSNKPEGLFTQTQAAVPDDDGTIWVTDTSRRGSLMHFSADGRYLGDLKSLDASSPISSPSRLAVSPEGDIYICETALDRIHVLRPDGSEIGTISVPQPVSVAVNKDRIAVGAVSGFAVLDKSGKPLGVNGSRGKGKDQFDYVHGIAFGPDGSIYVADSYNNRLSAYEPNGKQRWIIRTGAPANSAEMNNDMLTPRETTDTPLKGADALQLPLGLTVDGAGRVVVIDMFDSAIAVFDSKTGRFIGKYGDVGAEDGKFFYPVSISYDSGRDWFTVADAMNRRVQIVRIPGSSPRGAGVIAAASRTLAGPWRACAFPLLLLLAILAAFVASRIVRRRRAASAADQGFGADAA